VFLEKGQRVEIGNLEAKVPVAVDKFAVSNDVE